MLCTTGPGRRQRWSDNDKARIIAEAAQPSSVVTEVARRWQVSPQQAFDACAGRRTRRWRWPRYRRSQPSCRWWRRRWPRRRQSR
ncbi:transposase [Roseococcus suduntuyensis]|uniref:transposase n=1 Tax=Roseococcus suduntuyensis TaxID=455361 RepID=UPI0035D50338